jgi:hypothetical protein
MHHRIRPIRSAAVVLSTVALGAGVLAMPPATADVSSALRSAKAGVKTDSTPSTIAADWITGELTNGLIVGSTGPDFGLTLDTGLALASVPNRDAGVASLNTAFEPPVDE